MKKNSVQDYAVALLEVTRGLKGHSVSAVAKAFAESLVKAGMLSKASLIIKTFEHLVKKESGVKEIKITSARMLDEKTLSNIEKAFGDKVESKVSIDENLLGGFSVKSDDLVFDASIKTQLKNLKTNLINS